MAARKLHIDLLTREDITRSTVGRLLLFLLTGGRYIVIFTELVVIAGFVGRVILDRNLNGVNEDILEQKAILASYQPTEQRLRVVQQQLDSFIFVSKARIPSTTILSELSQVTPVDMRIISLAMSQQILDVSGVALSTSGLATFLARLQANSRFSDIILHSVATKGPQDPTLPFGVSVEIGGPPAAAAPAGAIPENPIIE